MNTKRVVMGLVTSPGWNGDVQVRLDLGPPGAAKPTNHIYVPEDDDLAGLPVGTVICLSAWVAPLAAKTGGKK